MGQESVVQDSRREAHAAWQAARYDEMSGAESWLGLIGLYWLKPGRNALGSASDAVIQLPDGPAWQGDVCWQEGQLYWQTADGVCTPLQTDALGPATAVDLENYRFFVVDRDGQLAVRLRDLAWAKRSSFAGLNYFPYADAWCIEAAWEDLAAPCTMAVPNVSGDLKVIEVRQQAVFRVSDERVTLLPMSVSPTEVFFVLRDRTSGKETYGAGRFLKAAPAVDGRMTLDFNFAYNPPCAFTAFATCPLPPAENWLAFPVRAGEMRYTGEGH